MAAKETEDAVEFFRAVDRRQRIEDLESDIRNELMSFWTYFALVMLFGFVTLFILWTGQFWNFVFGIFTAVMTGLCFWFLMVSNGRVEKMRQEIGRLELGEAVKPALRVEPTEPWPDPPPRGMGVDEEEGGP